MSEQQSVEQMDTTKEGIKGYLEDAAATLRLAPQSGAAHRLAVFRFILDTLKVTDANQRKAAWKQFSATPGWFGCNASAARQALDLASEAKAMVAEFDV